MKTKTVYVITDGELGYDCVCGVYTTIKKAIESKEFKYINGKNTFEHYEENSTLYISTKQLDE